MLLDELSAKRLSGHLWRARKGHNMTPSDPKTSRTYESLAQAAQRTEVSIKTLRRRIAAGQLPAYRYGPRIVRVDPHDVDKLMRPIPAARSN